MQNIQLKDLDWGLLWQQANSKKGGRRKQSTDWDQKADSFAHRTVHSVYTDRFIQLLAPKPDWSILDIGCGPGTLALPLAQHTQKVTALDFSGNMLDILNQRAEKQGLKNIVTCQLSWEGDWSAHDIKPHDIAIASRSLAVTDLKAALTRLNTFAVKRVCITDRVKSGPKDPEAFAAIGREPGSGPDYIYTINLLYQMGILPTVEYIRLEETMEYASFPEALAGYTWMFHNLTNSEKQRLEQYVRSISTTKADGTVTVQRRIVPIWAFISWKPIVLKHNK